MTDTDVSDAPLNEIELADLLVRLAREPSMAESKEWPKWNPYIRQQLLRAADRLRSPGGDGELVTALRDMPCIRPCNGRPDDFTVGQCVDAGECGCGNSAALSAAEATSAPTPAPVSGVDVKPLDWLTTYVDRGDGSKEESGWEADNGFNQWYSVEMYFGTDSYGWQVKFDCDVIADHDDPERAKAAAQEHFAARILSRLTASREGK